jgi:flagellar motor switch protein FliM
MRMQHDFAAMRAAAQHCAELTAHGQARGLKPEERAALMTAWQRDLARILADDLSGLLSGDRLEVSVSAPDMVPGHAALAQIGQTAANSLLRVGALGGAAGESALLSFDFATALALTDRSFGGDGVLAAGAPEQLPRSAALLVDEAAGLIAKAITRASYGDASPPAGAALSGEVIVRSESAARLKAFAPDAQVAVFTLAIANQHGCAWRATLALAAERLDRLLPQPGATPRRRASDAQRAPATGIAAPFANVPLPLHVVLAEFELSLARLQTLAPGDMIALAVGRQVPLMVGEQVVAHGSIGTAEDRMAIRLNRFPEFAEGMAW